MDTCKKSSIFECYKHNICRGCLATSSNVIPATDEILLNIFTEISNIRVLKESILPNRLCFVCLWTIRKFWSFKTRCEHSNTVLYRLLETGFSHNGEVFTPYVEYMNTRCCLVKTPCRPSVFLHPLRPYLHLFNLDDLLLARDNTCNYNQLTFSKIATVECNSLICESNESDIFNNSINNCKGVDSFTEFNGNDYQFAPHSESSIVLNIFQSESEHLVSDSSPGLKSNNVSINYLSVEPMVERSSLKMNSLEHLEVHVKDELNLIDFECSNDDLTVGIDLDRSLFNGKDKKTIEIEDNLELKETTEFVEVLGNYDKFEIDNVKCEEDTVESKTDSSSKQNVEVNNSISKVLMIRKSTSVRFKNINDSNKATNVKKRQLFSIIDKNRVNVLILTVQQQRREMEEAKRRKEYINSPFKCELCAKGYMFEANWRNHQDRHAESSGDHECEICHQRYKNVDSFRMHVLSHQQRLECRQCGKIFIGRAAMAAHIAKHNSTAESLPVCKICGKISKTKRNHTRHLKTHDPDKRAKCPECPKTFTETAAMHDHVARMHIRVKNFECEVCHHKFVTRNEVRMHSVKHSNQRDFYCVECDQAFKTKTSLNSHFRLSSKHANSDNSTFLCKECPNQYNSAKKLQDHIDSVHLRLLNWSCRRCPAKFTSRGLLRSHMTLHGVIREKPKDHPCHICGRVMASSNGLKNHLLTHTQERPHACEVCGDTFRQKCALITHTKLVHLKLKKPFPKNTPVFIKAILPIESHTNKPYQENNNFYS